MNRTTSRRTGLGVALIVMLTLTGVGTAQAADPGGAPTGVLAYDASLTVTFALPVDAGGGPIARAAVSVVAGQAGSTFQELNGTTGPDGSATFEGIARETAGGDPVLLGINAGLFPEPPTGECQTVKGWTGSADGIVAQINGAVEIVAAAAEADICGGDSGGGIPAGIVSDATLTVTVLDDAGLAFPNAEATLIASLADGQGIAKDFATTDSAGQVTFSGLPRPDVGGPAITWSVLVNHTSETPVDDCTQFDQWFGEVALEAAVGSSTATLPTVRQTPGIGCGDPGPGAPVIHGTVVGPDGSPFPIAYAQISQERPAGGTWIGALTIQPDGSFESPIHPWGTIEAPSLVVLSVLGEPLRMVTDEVGCSVTIALYGQSALDLAAATEADVAAIEIVAAERATETVCLPPGSDSGGSGPGPNLTLPPTDSAIGSAPASESRPERGPMIVLLTLAAMVFLALASAGRRARRTRPQSVR